MFRIFRRVFYQRRTFSHSILGTIVIYNVLRFILTKLLNPEFINPYIILISMMIGYISHLAADSFTKEGLSLLFPFKFNFGLPPVKEFRIKTGKFIENFIIFPLAWVFLIAVIYFNQEKLIKIISLIQ